MADRYKGTDFLEFDIPALPVTKASFPQACVDAIQENDRIITLVELSHTIGIPLSTMDLWFSWYKPEVKAYIKNLLTKNRFGKMDFLIDKALTSENANLIEKAMRLYSTSDQYDKLTNKPVVSVVDKIEIKLPEFEE